MVMNEILESNELTQESLSNMLNYGLALIFLYLFSLIIYIIILVYSIMFVVKQNIVLKLNLNNKKTIN